MTTYLDHYQIQHPDTRYEGVVTALQDLTREGHPFAYKRRTGSTI